MNRQQQPGMSRTYAKDSRFAPMRQGGTGGGLGGGRRDRAPEGRGGRRARADARNAAAAEEFADARAPRARGGAAMDNGGPPLLYCAATLPRTEVAR
jgi:hypothetical protein